MLHAKFRGNRPAGSGEDYIRVFSIYGRGDHLGHVTRMPSIHLSFPYPMRHNIKFCFDWPNRFRRCFKL